MGTVLSQPPNRTADAAPPPLVAGDWLDRAEFLRRWEAMPNLKRAELISGVVYMPSPVGRIHSSYEGVAGYWIFHYQGATPGLDAGDDATVLLPGDEVVQPDVHLRLLPEFGGTSKPEGLLLAGPPELVVEVCHTSSSYDLNQKLRLYQSAGVREYVAVLVREGEVRWHRLGSESPANRKYQRIEPVDGLHRSTVFPGLWLDPAALLRRDVAALRDALELGLRSPEHAAFVSELNRRSAARPENPR